MFPKIDPQHQFYLIIASFVALLIFGLPIAIRVWNDTRHGVDEESDTPEEILTPLEAAFGSGLMTEEEYNRVRGSAERVVGPSLLDDDLDGADKSLTSTVKKPIDGLPAGELTDHPPAADL